MSDDEPHTVGVASVPEDVRKDAPDEYEPICRVSISSGGHVTTFVLDTAEVAKLLEGVESVLDEEEDSEELPEGGR